MAIKCLITSGAALVAAYVLDTMALQRLFDEAEAMDVSLPAHLSWLSGLPMWLYAAPIAAVAISLAAIILKPVRGLLILPAMLATVIAVVVVIGSLVAGFAPLYGGLMDSVTEV